MFDLPSVMSALLSSQNGRAWATTSATAVAYLGFCSLVGRLGLLPPRLARKLTHIGTGPLYMLCWPLYSQHPASRWLCASVPALAGLRFAAVGSGVLRDPGLVASTSRSGRREELLAGPLWYAVAHVTVTLLCWRHSPSGIVALSVLCGGDGLAEVVGASLGGGGAPRGGTPGNAGGSSGSPASQPQAGTERRPAVQRGAGPGAAAPPRRHGRLPHNPDKSVAGSVACWLGGAAMALPLLSHFRRAGMFGVAGGGASAAAAVSAGAALPSAPALFAAVLLCSAVGAAVESLPLGDADNLAVTAAAAVTARAVFGF